MRNDVALKELKKAIGSARKVLVVCHIDPDADTVGSMIAVALMLKKMGKAATMLSLDPVPASFDFLPFVKYILNKVPRGEHFDLAIAVDAGDTRRIGALDLRSLSGSVVNIDHHPDNTMFGDINLVRQVSSTAELVYELCKYLSVPISKDIAVCLYTAIITDTGNFRYENTTASTFNIAADLYRYGASPEKIATKIYDNKSMAYLKLLATALLSSKMIMGGAVVWSTLSKRVIGTSGVKQDELTGIIDHLRSVKGSLIALLFREEKNGMVKVNLRSKGDVNVQRIASHFGGGGHRRASGISVKGNLRQIEGKVVSYIKGYLSSK